MVGDAPLPEPEVYVVFAQRADARVDIDAWAAHAERFLSTRLGLAEEKTYPAGAPVPRADRARFVIAPASGARDPRDAPGIREAHARPREERDLALAERADGDGSGLALLARRCPTVWIVTRESGDDRLALRLAAILSSVLLGPVLDPARNDLFGAKTARLRLDR